MARDLVTPVESRPGDSISNVSFREIFDEQAPFVVRTMRYLGIPEDQIEDLCQEVFLVVHQRLVDLKGREAVRPFVREVCVRTALAHRRKLRRRREQAMADPPSSAVDPDQIESLERREARATLNRFLDALDDKKRTVFVLYEIEQLHMEEIAEIVGCPLQTAYSRLQEARKKLRRRFAIERRG